MKYKAFQFLENGYIEAIDQRKLPFQKEPFLLKTSDDAFYAIKEMVVRGAGVIGNIGAIGVYLAALESRGDKHHVEWQSELLRHARPTAVNLTWAIDRMLTKLKNNKNGNSIEPLKKEAIQICEEDKENTIAIGKHGFLLIEDIWKRNGKKKVNILTHCNAGYLGIVDSGTALAPIYEAKKNGIDIHVWVDETRPRNQGSNLTSWELSQEGIEHTVIVDNTGGLLLQKKLVDIVFVGADRVTAKGDVANKIGTYLKALAAHDNNVPFYVAFPVSTFDFLLSDGLSEVEIELRGEEEIKYVHGLDSKGNYKKVLVTLADTKVANYGFDVTPNRLITGLITEKGICGANEDAIRKKYLN
ncbi:MAG: S-methyl-5-thioribose-1-phosphate isomerase [Leptospiraceae bacterium]|nr:S-methyl-5-thioribose-1-phosphate isomerase [Leptospiraceae bacterium]